MNHLELMNLFEIGRKKVSQNNWIDQLNFQWQDNTLMYNNRLKGL